VRPILHATYPNRFADDYRTAGHWLQQPLGVLFAGVAQRCADRIALIDADRQLTFRELDQLSQRVALGFRALGLGPGDVIGYQLPNWWEAVVVFLAALRAGATVNPLLPIFRESELRFTVGQSQARALIIPGTLRGCDHRQLLAAIREDLPALQHVFVVRDAAGDGTRDFAALLETPSALAPRTDSVALPAVDPDRVALLMYTSGTTPPRACCTRTIRWPPK